MNKKLTIVLVPLLFCAQMLKAQCQLKTTVANNTIRTETTDNYFYKRTSSDYSAIMLKINSIKNTEGVQYYLQAKYTAKKLTYIKPTSLSIKLMNGDSITYNIRSLASSKIDNKVWSTYTFNTIVSDAEITQLKTEVITKIDILSAQNGIIKTIAVDYGTTFRDEIACLESSVK